MLDQILSYHGMCEAENAQALQKGMNFRLNPKYSVILMSRRSNASYRDRVLADGITIEYEGHDQPRTRYIVNPKHLDQLRVTINGTFTQNGHFALAVEKYKRHEANPELVKVYEKILPGVWSLKGFFDLIDYKIEHDGRRDVFVFILKLAIGQSIDSKAKIDLKHTRLIPSEVKMEVWKRDHGKCVKCGSMKNLHFDHELPFSKGGTSLTSKNVRLLCMEHNLAKSAKIE